MDGLKPITNRNDKILKPTDSTDINMPAIVDDLHVEPPKERERRFIQLHMRNIPSQALFSPLRPL